jgi:hypothetical protein
MNSSECGSSRHALANPLTRRDSATMGEVSKVILLDALEQFRLHESARHLSVNEFRIRHEVSRAAIDGLLRDQNLKVVCDRYVPTLRALAEIGEEGRTEIASCNALIPVLQQMWRERFGESISVDALATVSGLPAAQLSRSLELLTASTIFTGWSSNQKTGVIESVTLHESVLDLQSAAANLLSIPTGLRPPDLYPATLSSIDFFICHASEDKKSVAEPLASELRRLGHGVWFDADEMTIGDSLGRRIDEGVLQARFGVVILSQSFFKKYWTRSELGGFEMRESTGQLTILPIWHDVTLEQVTNFSPRLAARIASHTSVGIASLSLRVHEAAQGARLSHVNDVQARTVSGRDDGSNAFSLQSDRSRGNWIMFKDDDKYEPNGVFDVSASLVILVGEKDITPLSFFGRYYAQGCPSFDRAKIAWTISGEAVKLSDFSENVARPVVFGARSTHFLTYRASFRPPTMNMVPASDCDFGDLQIKIQYRLGDLIDTLVQTFAFRKDGTLERTEAVRGVPRLHDEELNLWLAMPEASLPSFTLHDDAATRPVLHRHIEALLRIDPISRYMASRTSNTTALVAPMLTAVAHALFREGLPGRVKSPSV